MFGRKRKSRLRMQSQYHIEISVEHADGGPGAENLDLGAPSGPRRSASQTFLTDLFQSLK